MYKNSINCDTHETRVEHWLDWLEDCPESITHVLRVSVPLTVNTLQGPREVRLHEQCQLTAGDLERHWFYKGNVDIWKRDTVPILIEKVMCQWYRKQLEQEDKS